MTTRTPWVAHEFVDYPKGHAHYEKNCLKCGMPKDHKNHKDPKFYGIPDNDIPKAVAARC